jgi:hypothetical protein
MLVFSRSKKLKVSTNCEKDEVSKRTRLGPGLHAGTPNDVFIDYPTEKYPEPYESLRVRDNECMK